MHNQTTKNSNENSARDENQTTKVAQNGENSQVSAKGGDYVKPGV